MEENGTIKNPNNTSETTNEATIQSNAAEVSESSIKHPETSEISMADDVDDVDGGDDDDDDVDEKSIEFSDKLMEKGNLAFKESDFSEASDFYSRALEIRVSHYGELAPECINSYYKFGRALLYKAQEEADPLGSMPKKDAESRQGSLKIESTKNNIERESSLTSVSSTAEQSASSSQLQGTDNVPSKDEGNEDEDSDTEEPAEPAEPEEDESDLDLAWKMLDLARAISEKHSKETMEMVDILSALAEVSLEREDIETSLSDYEKALTILESLVEPDNRRIAELNFRICLCLEVGSKAQEAIPYCEKAISICKSRMQRLVEELKAMSAPQSDDSVSDKKSEIQTLKSLSSDLEKKLEDLQQLISNPTSILTDILGLAAAKGRATEQASATPSAAGSSSRVGIITGNGDFDSPTVSSAHTTNGSSGVTHLGVVGRGVKRVNVNSGHVESSPSKKPAIDSKPETGDDSGA